MGVDHSCSREEVQRMLYLSERGLQPTAPAAMAHASRKNLLR